MLFGAADLMTQRRLHEGVDGHRHEAALEALERYANATTCRQQILCAHFTGGGDHAACTRCDACVDPEAVRGAGQARAGGRARQDGTEGGRTEVPALGAAVQQVILEAVAAAPRRVGRVNLAKALRGSHARAVVAQGLTRLPHYGTLGEVSEEQLLATIDQLIRERRLVRRGRTYPTVALPSPPRPRRSERTPAAARPRQRTSSVTLALDTYRKRMARQLKWKAYMVFQRGVIAAIDQQRPTSKEALARIPGLGPAKIARFGDDILAVVRRESPPRSTDRD
jgi:ATP-dependent DNA helicase RecQ